MGGEGAGGGRGSVILFDRTGPPEPTPPPKPTTDVTEAQDQVLRAKEEEIPVSPVPHTRNSSYKATPPRSRFRTRHGGPVTETQPWGSTRLNP